MGCNELTHRVSHVSIALILLCHKCQIQHDPSQHAWSQFAEGLDIDLAKSRNRDTRVHFAANEPIIDDISAVTSWGELALLFVVRLDRERVNVHERRESIRYDDVARKDLDVVSVDESPDLKIGTQDPCACRANNQGCNPGEECFKISQLGQIRHRSVFTHC